MPQGVRNWHAAGICQSRCRLLLVIMILFYEVRACFGCSLWHLIFLYPVEIYRHIRTNHFSSSGAGGGIFWLWGPIPCLLTPWLLKSTEHQILSVWDRQYVLLLQSSIHLFGSSQIQDTIHNVIIYSIIFKTIQHIKCSNDVPLKTNSILATYIWMRK